MAASSCNCNSAPPALLTARNDDDIAVAVAVAVPLLLLLLLLVLLVIVRHVVSMGMILEAKEEHPKRQ